MALPTIANVYRVTWNWRGLAHNPVNVMHFSAPTLNESELGEAIDDALGGLADESHLFWPLPAAAICDNLDIIKLDGSSATVNVSLSNEQMGAASGAVVYQASGVVTLHTTHRGPSGRGRVFCGPVAEDGMAGGEITPAGVVVWQQAWTDFPILCFAESCQLGVASYEHEVFRVALPATCRTYVATQRRRAKFLQG